MPGPETRARLAYLRLFDRNGYDEDHEAQPKLKEE